MCPFSLSEINMLEKVSERNQPLQKKGTNISIPHNKLLEHQQKLSSWPKGFKRGYTGMFTLLSGFITMRFHFVLQLKELKMNTIYFLKHDYAFCSPQELTEIRSESSLETEFNESELVDFGQGDNNMRQSPKAP
jgi:hypothetical protein